MTHKNVPTIYNKKYSKRSAFLKIRCAPELIELVEAMRFYKESASDVIHESIAMYAKYDMCAERNLGREKLDLLISKISNR